MAMEFLRDVLVFLHFTLQNALHRCKLNTDQNHMVMTHLTPSVCLNLLKMPPVPGLETELACSLAHERPQLPGQLWAQLPSE